ncbi:hypothetical protein [Candidatus Lokiarchaeum ossiferum]|uniref:hypothetical protein n=1 Tax=Candidatus Lokiarchaeum ossiferum TaxID=2951803 RepID=UPI00352CC507
MARQKNTTHNSSPPAFKNPDLCQELIWDHYGRTIQCQAQKLPDTAYCAKHHAMFLKRKAFLAAHPSNATERKKINETIAFWDGFDAKRQKQVHAEGEHYCYSCNCTLDEDNGLYYCDRCGTEHDICEECIGKVRGYGEMLCDSCENELGLLQKACTRCHEYNDDNPTHFVICTQCQLVMCKECIDPQDDCEFPNPSWLCHTCRAGIPLLDDNENTP